MWRAKRISVCTTNLYHNLDWFEDINGLDRSLNSKCPRYSTKIIQCAISNIIVFDEKIMFLPVSEL